MKRNIITKHFTQAQVECLMVAKDSVFPTVQVL